MSWTKHSLIFRSSLSWKHHIDVGAGVVDRDYRGNVGVVLFNLSQMDYEVQQGDRIAQLIIERISNPPLVEVKVIFKKCFDLLVYKLILKILWSFNPQNLKIIKCYSKIRWTTNSFSNIKQHHLFLHHHELHLFYLLSFCYLFLFCFHFCCFVLTGTWWHSPWHSWIWVNRKMKGDHCFCCLSSYTVFHLLLELSIPNRRIHL